MSEVISSHKVELSMNIVDFFSFLLTVIPKSKAHQLIESHNMQTEYGSAPNEEDSIYCRAVETIQGLSYDLLKERFLAQLEYGNCPEFEGEDLQDLLEQGALSSIDNFGTPTHAIKLEEDLYVVGPVTAEDITLRSMSETEGAIIVYTPAKFSILRIKEKICQQKIG